MSKLTLSGSPLGNGTVTLSAPNAYVNRTMYLPDASTELVGTDAPQTLTNKNLIMPSVALDYYPTAGRIEYDGSALYGSHSASGRGVLMAPMAFRLAAPVVGANASGPQNIFGVGMPLMPNTAYWFELFFVLQKTAGIVSHTVSVLFGSSGMSAVTSFLAGGNTFATAASNAYDGTAGTTFSTTPATAAAISGATTAAAFTRGYSGRGTFTTPAGAGHEFRPQYSLSAAPGGAYSTLAGSYVLLAPIGPANTGNNINIGNWA